MSVVLLQFFFSIFGQWYNKRGISMCCIMLTGAIIASLVAAWSSLSEYWESTNKLAVMCGSSSIPVILYYILKTYMWLRKIPPGPWGIPGLGSMWELNWNNSILKCQQYAKQFGKLFQMRVGLFKVVVLSDYKVLLESFRREELQGRPDFELWKFRNRDLKNRGILMSDANSSWDEQRRLASEALQSGIIGKESIEEAIVNEAKELIRSLKQQQGQTVNLKEPLTRSMFNSLWGIMCGKRAEPNDRRFKEVMSMIGSRWDKALLFSLNYFLPWVAKLNIPGLCSAWDSALQITENMTDSLDEVIKEHVDNYNRGLARDYIDIYLQRHYEESSRSFSGREGLQNLRVTLLDLIQSGTEKTSATLQWALLYIARSPHMQRKLQEEIHLAIGSDRPPRGSDRAKMPYLEAFTTEVHRRGSVTPFSVLHQVTQDCQFAGYSLEKGTIVVPNIYAAHHDETVWGSDANKFRPERFLDVAGNKLKPKEALVPFGSGKRKCVGQTLAQDTIFIFLSMLLQNFSFEMDPSSPDVDVYTPVPCFISTPGEFKVIVTLRPTRY